MRQTFFGPLIAATAILISMCGGAEKPIVDASPHADASPPRAALPGPSSKVVIPTPEEDWTPVCVGAEKGKELAAALRDRKKIAVVVPKAHDARELEDRLDKMVKTVAPDTAVTARSEAVLDKYLVDKTHIPYRDANAGEAASSTTSGPVYLPKDDPLSAEWRSKKGGLRNVDAVLIVRPIKVDEGRMSEMREPKTGGCDAEESALERGISDAGAYFAPYEAKARELLGREFARSLHKAAPFWRQELKQVAEIAVSSTQTARCAAAYEKFLDKYDTCLKGVCPLGPRLFAVRGLVGMVDESELIPDACPTAGMRDYAAEILKLGDRALAEVMPTLSDAWNGEMLRIGGLADVRRGVGDICLPRVRRVREEDAAAARTALHKYLVELRDGAFEGTWEPMPGQERIVGVGPVRVLARVKATMADPRVQAAALIKQMRGMSRCTQGKGRLLQVSLVDTRSSEVLYMDIFFEESLLCEDVPPK